MDCAGLRCCIWVGKNCENFAGSGSEYSTEIENEGKRKSITLMFCLLELLSRGLYWLMQGVSIPKSHQVSIIFALLSRSV